MLSPVVITIIYEKRMTPVQKNRSAADVREHSAGQVNADLHCKHRVTLLIFCPHLLVETPQTPNRFRIEVRQVLLAKIRSISHCATTSQSKSSGGRRASASSLPDRACLKPRPSRVVWTIPKGCPGHASAACASPV